MQNPKHLALAVLAACLLSSAAAAAASPKDKGASSQSADTAVVDINTATAKELLRLPNVGKSRAAAIIKLRTRLGGFDRVEQLMKVRGIGRKTFRKMRPMVTVGHAKKAKRSRK